MASGFTKNGGATDLDVLFEPRIWAAVPNTGYTISGVDLAQRYEKLGTGDSVTNTTGFKTSTGKDLSEIFCCYGSAASRVIIDDSQSTGTMTQIRLYPENSLVYQSSSSGEYYLASRSYTLECYVTNEYVVNSYLKYNGDYFQGISYPLTRITGISGAYGRKWEIMYRW